MYNDIERSFEVSFIVISLKSCSVQNRRILRLIKNPCCFSIDKTEANRVWFRSFSELYSYFSITGEFNSLMFSMRIPRTFKYTAKLISLILRLS